MALESSGCHDQTLRGRYPISVNFDLERSWFKGSDFIKLKEEAAKEYIGYEYLK